MSSLSYPEGILFTILKASSSDISGFSLKVTSATKRFFHKVALGMKLMNFFHLKEKFSFYRYLDFVFPKSRFQNLRCHHRHCYLKEVTLMLISFEF